MSQVVKTIVREVRDLSRRVPGISSVLKLRPEIKGLIEKGEFESIRKFDPSPSLANVVKYFEYSKLLNYLDMLPGNIKRKCEEAREIGKRLDVFVDPAKLFERTYLSENMDDVIVKVFAALLGVSEAIRRDGTVTALRSRIVILPSLMGGGKTHLLITLLHLVELYNEMVYRLSLIHI